MFQGEVSWLTLALLLLKTKKNLATSHTTQLFSSTNQKQDGSPGPVKKFRFSQRYTYRVPQTI